MTNHAATDQAVVMDSQSPVWKSRIALLAGVAVSCFALVQPAWSADSNANDGGSGESACDEGESGECPPENASSNDTVDAGEGDIPQDEDTCNENSGASNAGEEEEPGGETQVRPVNSNTALAPICELRPGEIEPGILLADSRIITGEF